MAHALEFRNGSSQKLTLACAMALSGLAFVSDAVASAAPLPPQPKKLVVAPATFGEAASVTEVLAALLRLDKLLDDAYAMLLANRVPAFALQNHPFDTAAKLLARGLQELKPMRGTGELGPDGDSFITAYAEARRKAERNAHLIRQMTVKPTVFHSDIDRSGLIALSRIAATSH